MRSIEILDHWQLCRVDYSAALKYRGGAIAGLAIGFRATEAAGLELSRRVLWDRKDLHVVSGHPGPGVRDAIEAVTRCVSRDRFRVETDLPEGRVDPARGLAYAFIVYDGRAVVEVMLWPGRVGQGFAALLRRVRGRCDAVDSEVEAMKASLAGTVLESTLSELFELRVTATNRVTEAARA